MCQQELRIHTDRLIMRPVREGDWPDIQRIWEGVNASPYARFDRPHNTDSTDVQGRIARWAAAGQGPDHFFFAVCLCKTVIGYIAFNRRPIGYEAGYLIRRTTAKGMHRKACLLSCGLCKTGVYEN